MKQSRRAFVAGSLATTIAAPSMARAVAGQLPLADSVVSLFDPFPGQKALKIWAPATEGKPEFLAALNAADRLFVGSAFKSFVLCEALRQVDSPTVVKQISQTQLRLDASVWVPDSATFNPPNLTGAVSERTALEAMILHSDNTGTDMALRQVGADNVRKFIASIGLRDTLIPDSIRTFFGYLFGVPDFKAITWDELVALANSDAPIVNSPLNDVETLASSADDFVSYYSRALQGAFFRNEETLSEFRRILSLGVGDTIAETPAGLPLGVSAFTKAGSIDVPGFHCLCIAGGMFFSSRWVFFALIINWEAPGQTDPDTAGAYITAVRQALAMCVTACRFDR